MSKTLSAKDQRKWDQIMGWNIRKDRVNMTTTATEIDAGTLNIKNVRRVDRQRLAGLAKLSGMTQAEYLRWLLALADSMTQYGEEHKQA